MIKGKTKKKGEAVNHPLHYGGDSNPYEAIKVIEAWDLGFSLGNAVKYISRAGKKDDIIQDLEKAAWYLQRQIDKLKHKRLGESIVAAAKRKKKKKKINHGKV